MSKYQSTQEEFNSKTQAQDMADFLSNRLSNFWVETARTAGGALKNTFVIAECNKYSGRWYGFFGGFAA